MRELPSGGVDREGPNRDLIPLLSELSGFSLGLVMTPVLPGSQNPSL